MFGFVRNLVPHRGTPIGVDMGTRTLRLAQIDDDGGELRLVHAEAIDATPNTMSNDAARSEFFVAALRDALRSARFRGRQIAVSLPASLINVKHLRIPRGGDAREIATQVREQMAAHLGGDVGDWFVRHVVAGDVFGEQSPQLEVVAFAAPADSIQQLIEDVSAARAELVGVQVPPRIVVDAFGHFYRRKADADAVNLFVDLGTTSTRAIVAAPVEVRFVRDMAVGVAQVHERIAAAMKSDLAAVNILRRSTIAQQTGRSNEIPAQAPTLSDPQVQLQEATATHAQRLSDELDLCRRYYEATFPSKPVTRLVFVGGGAKDRLLCAAVAQAMSLPAQIGDPLVRFNRSTLPSLGCIDRREPQPEWAVAIGLSLCGQTVSSSALAAA